LQVRKKTDKRRNYNYERLKNTQNTIKLQYGEVENNKEDNTMTMKDR
jgi:hypothetical protein